MNILNNDINKIDIMIIMDCIDHKILYIYIQTVGYL